MIYESLYIERYDWLAHCFFDVGREDVKPILALLQTIGISMSLYHKVRRHLLRADVDTGFTYTRSVLGESVMVIGKASSAAESFNTFTHELRHLADDIAGENDIPLHGEPVAYLTGDMALAMAGSFLPVICRCPVCSRHFSREQVRKRRVMIV